MTKEDFEKLFASFSNIEQIKSYVINFTKDESNSIEDCWFVFVNTPECLLTKLDWMCYKFNETEFVVKYCSENTSSFYEWKKRHEYVDFTDENLFLGSSIALEKE
jgi:hypothetical protein